MALKKRSILKVMISTICVIEYRNNNSTDSSLKCIPLYKKIIYLSFYPNVMLWIDLIRQKFLKEKVIALIEKILEM